MKQINITGQRFGYLIALAPGVVRNGKPRWVVRCDCGVMKAAYYNDLKNGQITSCGCQTKTNQKRRFIHRIAEHR